MNLFERIERLRQIVVSSEYDENPRIVGIHINERVFEKPVDYGPNGGMLQAQAMAARCGQPPPPKGKWIACVGKFWADDDDPTQAVSKLEIEVVKKVHADIAARLSDRRSRLKQTEELAAAVAAIVEGVPSGSTGND